MLHHHYHPRYWTMATHCYRRVLKTKPMKIIFHQWSRQTNTSNDNAKDKHHSSITRPRVVSMSMAMNQQLAMINRHKWMSVKSNVYSNVFIVKLSSKILLCTVHISNCITHRTIRFVVLSAASKKRTNTISSFMSLNKRTSSPDSQKTQATFSLLSLAFISHSSFFFGLYIGLFCCWFSSFSSRFASFFFICHDTQEKENKRIYTRTYEALRTEMKTSSLI